MQIINCHGWDSNPGSSECESDSKPTEPLMSKVAINYQTISFLQPANAGGNGFTPVRLCLSVCIGMIYRFDL